MQLRIPGPTPLPDEVLDAMSAEMVSHRGPEFHALLEEVTLGLREGFATEGDVLIFPAAGTGGLEAAIANLFSAGDTVISLSIGSFGDRFAEIAERFGPNVVRVASAWGEAADLDGLKKALAANADVRGVLVTHNETSTGVQNDVEAVGRVLDEYAGTGEGRPLLVVDAISSLGAVSLPVDEWGIDVAVTASQKAWMAAPGLAMLSVSERAWAANRAARLPRYYWDFEEARRFLRKWETPYTPAVSLLFGLRAAIRLMQAEGWTALFARHEALRDQVRTAGREMGLKTLAGDAVASRTVTAFRVPHGSTATEIVRLMRTRGVVIAGGQDALKESIFRVGHMGYASQADLEETMVALKECLRDLERAAA